MLSRCMRGGKTTVLGLLFRKLREEGYSPVFVSFNSDYYISRLGWECNSVETLTRAIAIAVMKTQPANAETVQCSEKVLIEFFNKKNNVVLLIDEMNVLLGSESADQH
jgi:hypothetical protein